MKINFDEFKQEWLDKQGITKDLSVLEKRQQFALKLLTDYYEIPDDYEYIYYLDSTDDSGIDIALTIFGENEEIGDTWYLIQSKVGNASKGNQSLLTEAKKIFNTIGGQHQQLAPTSKQFVEQLNYFISKSGENDKLVLIFATESPITHENELRSLEEIEILGKTRFKIQFEAKLVSVYSIYEKATTHKGEMTVKVLLKAKLANLHKEGTLLAGAAKLTDLYDFLKQYRQRIGGDLDRIFERNIRKFLGLKGKINRKIKETLRDAPENFGLYNNGITIIVNRWQRNKNINSDTDSYTLYDPFVVNGSQTVSTIWRVLKDLDDAVGKEDKEQWRIRYENALIVIKIAKVGDDDKLLENITRYTNSQNAIKDKDFLALNSDFIKFKKDFVEKYQIFLEVHRGDWTSQLALQKKYPHTKPFFNEDKGANIFELIKVYGAGWLGTVGEAINQNALFTPNGRIFKAIMNQEDENFGVDDLFAAFAIFKFVDQKEVRKELKTTKFIFYRVVIELLKPIIAEISEDHHNKAVITQCLLRLIADKKGFDTLMQETFLVMKAYLNKGNPNSYVHEPSMVIHPDFTTFVKKAKLFDPSHSPKLLALINIHMSLMNYDTGNGHTRAQILKEALLKTKMLEISPVMYAQSISELQHLDNPKLTWMEICQHLKIEVGKTSSRLVLKKWVKKNRTNWPQLM
jgi:AIPR protein